MTLSTSHWPKLVHALEQGFFAVEEVGVFVASEVLHGPSGVALEAWLECLKKQALQKQDSGSVQVQKISAALTAQVLPASIQWERKRGAKVPKPASLPRFIAEESLLTALRADSSPFQSPPHSQDNLLCLFTAFVDYRLRELEKWAEELNTVDSKGVAAFLC